MKAMKKAPKDWSDVTLNQLIEIEAIRNDKSIDKELYPDLTRGLLILSTFTKIPYSEYEKLPIAQLKSEIAKISFLGKLPTEKKINKFYCKGYVWNVTFDLKTLSAQQFINHYELTKDTDKIFENAHKLMAIYCEPTRIIYKPKLTDEEKAELLRHCPVDVIYPLVLFFCNLYPLLLEGIEDYLKLANTMLSETMERAIKENQQAA